MTATTLIPGFTSAMTCMAPSTLAEPPISYFISSMPSPGFRLMPPVSKVMPLPTSTWGLSLALPPRYSMMMKRGGWVLPLPTARMVFMPSFSICFSSSTSVLMTSWSFASFLACSASQTGWQIFGGVLPRSLVKFMPRPVASPRLKASLNPLPAAEAVTVILLSLLLAGFSLL